MPHADIDRRAGDEAPPGPSRRVAAAALALITLAGLGLRAAALDRHGLWGDEGFSLLMAGLGDVRVWGLDQHPPLYYALLRAWSAVAAGDAGLRALSVLLGTAAIPAVYALGAALFTRSVGLWSAAIVATSWMHAHHSRELRMYPLLFLCAALALLGAVRGARDGRPSGWALYAGAGALLAWSHGLGILYAGVVAALAWTWLLGPGAAPARGRRAWAWATAAMAVAFLPWAAFYALRVRGVATRFWIGPTSPEPPVLTTIHELLLSPLPAPGAILRAQLGIAAPAWLGTWIWVAVVLGALALVLLRPPVAAAGALRFLALAYLLPIGALAAVGAIVRPILIPRVLLPVLAPLAVLLGAVAVAVPRRPAAGLAAGAVLAVVALGGLYGLRYDAGYHEQWREVSRDLQQRAAPGDAIVLVGGDADALPPERRSLDRGGRTARLLLDRYDAEGRLARIPRPSIADLAVGCRLAFDDCLRDGLGAYAPGTTVWLVRYGSGLRRPVEPWLQARLDVVERRPFDGVHVDRAVVRAPAP